jgi:hypothetical protein
MVVVGSPECTSNGQDADARIGDRGIEELGGDLIMGRQSTPPTILSSDIAWITVAGDEVYP